MVAAAVICLAIGLGNYLVGQSKYAEYQKLLSEAQSELARPERPLPSPFPGPTVNIDKETRYILRLRDRLDFYGFVMRGGQYLLAVGLLALAAGLLMGSKGLEQE